MASNKNDDMDRSGNRSTPQGSTPQNSPQSRDTMNRDGAEGRNITNQGRTGAESFKPGLRKPGVPRH